MKVEWGSLVSLDYDALLDSGRQIDSSAVNGPLRLRIGEWQNLPGLASKLVGLEQGDERLIRLSPAEAFGEWDPNAILTMREARLSGDNPLEDGDAIRVEAPGALRPSAVSIDSRRAEWRSTSTIPWRESRSRCSSG